MAAGDVIDLKAYLDTFAPVRTKVAASSLRFPWSIRRGVGLWKRLYLDPRPVIDVDPESPVLLRGRYLVEALGHCGECHTPRNLLGASDTSRWLAGAPSLDGEGKVPNITPSKRGLASWSSNDIAYYLKSGFTPDYDTVGGSMVEVQENIAKLPDSDREAIAAYLKAIPAVPGSVD
jgi:mono/diheme cytochrome c family protein